MKGKIIKNKERLRLSRQAELLFLIILPIILAELLVLVSDFLTDYRASPSYAFIIYPPMFEYIMMSLAILTGGGLLFDYIVKSEK